MTDFSIYAGRCRRARSHTRRTPQDRPSCVRYQQADAAAQRTTSEAADAGIRRGGVHFATERHQRRDALVHEPVPRDDVRAVLDTGSFPGTDELEVLPRARLGRFGGPIKEAALMGTFLTHRYQGITPLWVSHFLGRALSRLVA